MFIHLKNVGRLIFIGFILSIPICQSAAALGGSPNASLQRGLTVSPLRNEFDVTPGTSYEGELVITNSTKNKMKVNLSSEAFSVINQQYDYAFTSESDVASWVNFSNSELQLSPDESRVVRYNVGVPLSAEPGGRYISLFAANDIQSIDGNVKSQQRIASFLYFTVTGKVSRVGSLVSLNSQWLINDNSNWSAIIRNSGTTHFRSKYDVRLRNIIDNNVIATKSGSALILPGTVRSVGGEIPLPSLPGIYKVEYVIGLGDTPSQTATRLMLYFPYWLVGLIFFIIVCIVFRLVKKRFIFKIS